MGKKSLNAEALSIFIGNRMMPGGVLDGNRPISIGEAEKIAKKRRKARGEEER
jgi:hypothetical protein